GRELKAAIENGLSQLPSPAGRFPQLSGLKVEADMRRPPGSRITLIRVGDAPLDETRIYRVAINDFMGRGGDGYVMFGDARHVTTAADAPTVASEVINYIKAVGTLRTGVQGRLVVR